jgi:hypothetical protein
MNYLTALETGGKLVTVDRLILDRETASKDSANKRSGAEALSMSATVIGYRLTHQVSDPADDEVDPSGRSPLVARRFVLADVDDAVSSDLFDKSRKRPSVRYRLPGEADPAPLAVKQGPPRMSLIGTMIGGPATSFALCQLAGEAPKLVRLGGRIGVYTLRAVEKTKATFALDDGTTIEVRVPPPGA